MSGELPFTGFSVALLGVAFGLSWLVVVAVCLVMAGVVVRRVATRAQRKGAA